MNLALHAPCELECAVAEREQRVVLAATDVLAGMEMRAALTYDNVARMNELTGKSLDAKSLRVGIASVARGA